LRIRRRQIDALRLAIGAEQDRASELAAEVARVRAARDAERRLAASGEVPADAWFAASSRHLRDLAGVRAQIEQRLVTLRQAAREASARLSLLEQADAAAQAVERRASDKAAQAALDDRTAASWSRR
jgi:hypothetical protein